MNVLFKELANDKFDGQTYICENLGCEYLCDIGSLDILMYNKESYARLVKDRAGRNYCPDSFHWNQMNFKI